MTDLDLHTTVVESYIHQFYGHGSYQARYWFVGMESGGGGTWAEIASRIQGWYERGGKELEDLGPNGVSAGSRWFLPRYPLQPTWAKLIRVVLTAEGRPASTESVRSYQKDYLGRTGGLDCLLELLPLPSPGLARWDFYPSLADRYPQLAYLKDRRTYTERVAPMRIAHLRARISEHKPRAVIFYGTSYRHWWQEVTGARFESSVLPKVLIAKREPTLLVIMQHPAARGVSKSYFDAVGRLIAESSIP
jgi:hypothetical protein